MISLTRPRYFVPVHGEYRHLVLHSRLAEEQGLRKDHVYILEDGHTLEFGDFTGSGEVTAQLGEVLPTGHVYVDGLGVGDVGSVVLRDRKQLSQDGFIVCIVAIDEYDGEVVYGPEILSRGFVYVREQEELIKRAQEAVSKVIKKKTPASVLENKIKDALGNFAAREIGRRPMILPLVIEV
jgi:ribonuclease J